MRATLIKIFALILYSTVAIAQDLPDAPQPQPAATCGPKWAGGCWDYSAARRSNWAVIKDPYFWGPTAVDGLATAYDATVTRYGLDHSACHERNSDLGSDPSTGKIVGINLLVWGATTGFRFVALKVIPKDSHSRLVWIPRALSIGTVARSAQVHIMAANSWFSSGCL